MGTWIVQTFFLKNDTGIKQIREEIKVHRQTQSTISIVDEFAKHARLSRKISALQAQLEKECKLNAESCNKIKTMITSILNCLWVLIVAVAFMNSTAPVLQKMYEYSADTIQSLNLDSLDLGDKKYDELCQIGCGAYGTVFKARDLQNKGNYVAMKKLRVKLNEDGIPMSTLREISILKQLDTFEHPNIVRFFDVIHQNILSDERYLTVYLIFEHVDQDLGSYMEKCPPPGLSASKVKELTRQMLKGVDFLHSHRIIHRDLKPQNLLITRAGGLKIADFGLAKTFDYDMMLTSVVVTLWYRAPEILLNLGYGTPVDIWSIGCVMAEMWRLVPLFCASTEVEQLKCIFRVIGTPSMNEWPENISLMWSSFEQYSKVAFSAIFMDCCSKANSLLESMLTFNPADRISAADALEHPYFKEKENEPL
ncbi:hypothetical protein M8J76_001435 [Diaphorina citri]|nr:hypothetical protein M8J76_001435 [Diaphorina citri]